MLGALPSRDAAPALLEIATFPLERAERRAFAAASVKLADARLVAPLARLLVPSEPDVWQPAVAALLKIDSDAAAQALAPHLPEEPDLGRKLEVAAFLGRHGVRAGYPYAIEHLAEPELLERAVVALAAIRDPRAVGELRRILETSNDVAWNRAAIRGLGKLGVGEVAPRFLAIARTPQSPLAPAALIALGDLREPQALALVRAGFASRNPEMLAASARAAGTLGALPGAGGAAVRDQLAALLADPAAPEDAREAALGSLQALADPRLDGAVAQAVRDGGLEGSDLLARIEHLLRDRQVKLATP